MKTLITKSTLFCLLLFISVTASFAQSNEEIKRKIEQMNAGMAKAMISGDMDKSMSYYAKDVISLPNYEKILNGIEAVKKSNEEMKKAGWKVIEFIPSTSSVMNCGDMIIEIGTFEIAFSMEGVDAPMKDEGKYVTIWEKQMDGSLKIKVETWNTDKFPVMEEKK